MAKTTNKTATATETVAAAAEAVPTNDGANSSSKYADLVQEFVSVSQGFPPYFKFENDGDAIYGKVVGLDASNPEFLRYVVEAVAKPVTCSKGPVSDSVDVVVEPGEFFTVSAYAALDMEQLLDIPALIIRTKETTNRSDPKKSTINFDVRVAASDLKLVKARQKDALAFQLEAARRTIGGAKALQAGAQV